MKWILSLSTLSLALATTACGSPSNASIPLPPKNYDTINDVARPVGDQVDQYYSSYRELTKERADGGYQVDGCDPALGNLSTFADRIAFAVEEGMRDRKAQLSYVSSAFKLPAKQEDFLENSFLSNWYCPVTAYSLRQNLRKNVPSQATIAKAQSFADRMNEFRKLAVRGDSSAILGAHRLWSRFMMCLAYTESLTTADTASSRHVAERYDIEKAEGVKFYLDPAQSNPKSKFNIGLFQFSPDSGGNPQACLRAWNQRFPGCAMKTNSSFAEMVSALSSSRQTFNAFCGAVKITDMFAVQINTTAAGNTDTANRMDNGKLLPSALRCVTPFFRVGASYNHFGPLQNSTGSNMKTLMDCTMAE
jgi:hypothetical protein